MPKVSVVIPAFNASLFLDEAITSVIGQSFRDFEIVVVDDGSVDETRQVAERYPEVKYLYQQNRGESGARNTGIGHAEGCYLAFLDADDSFLPEKLEFQVSLLDRHPGIAIVYSDVNLCNASGTVRGLFSRQVCQPERDSSRVFQRLVRGNFLTVNSVLVRRKVLDQVGLFDESIHTFPDWDLWLRIAAEHEFSYIDLPLANYRIHENMASRDFRKMWKGALAVRRKLITLPAFRNCPSDVQSYGYYQLGLLNCLMGDTAEGRRHLALSFRNSSTRAAAGMAFVISLLGRQALQAAVHWRLARHGWVAQI